MCEWAGYRGTSRSSRPRPRSHCEHRPALGPQSQRCGIAARRRCKRCRRAHKWARPPPGIPNERYLDCCHSAVAVAGAVGGLHPPEHAEGGSRILRVARSGSARRDPSHRDCWRRGRGCECWFATNPPASPEGEARAQSVSLCRYSRISVADNDHRLTNQGRVNLGALMRRKAAGRRRSRALRARSPISIRAQALLGRYRNRGCVSSRR